MKLALIGLTIMFSLASLANDPMFNQQWGLENSGQSVWRSEGDIRRETIVGTPGIDIVWPGLEALKNLGQDREVIVAVLDTGIDMTHPEFSGRLYNGKDFLDDAAMVDDMGHGTHVAGIIAANVNGFGTQGVTPAGVKILPLKVLSQKVQGFVYKKNPNDSQERGRVITDIIADAIVYAIQAKASVINMSLGWPQLVNSPRVIRALEMAAEKGVVIVAASGNNNKDVPTWPCSHPAVICVGAMDNQGQITEFSNHGGKVDLVAPGEWIVSTFARNLESRTLRVQGYEAKNGSSQASPFVAAAAALLKLQNPDITAQQVKAKLYASAIPLARAEDQRFVRFGALSIKGALEIGDVSLASVLVKSLVTVSVEQDGRFDFTLPIEVLGSTTDIPRVSISGLAAQTSVEGENVRVQGRILDLNRDSEIPVVFTTTLGKRSTQTRVTLSMARVIHEDDLISTPLGDLQAANLLSIQGERKLSKAGQVAVEDIPSSDFHGFIIKRSGDDVVLTSIRASANGSAAILTEIELPRYQQLLSVFEKDVNLDGKNDLIFYGINSSRDSLVLTFTDLKGRPLFGENSRWEMAITTFEGLPLKEDGARADFAWIKHKTFLGEILLPYYQKSWQMPAEDNSQDLLDHEMPGADMRLYYWEPYKSENKTLARPRVVDTVAFKKKLRNSLNPAPWETVAIERMLPQSQSERAQGKVRHVVSVGEGFFRKFSILESSSVIDFTLRSHIDNDVFQTGNTSLPTRKLSDFSFSQSSFQLALLDRSNARIKPMVEGKVLNPWTVETSGWSNPFFEVVATFEGDDRRVLFFESRYHVYVYDQSGNSTPGIHKLPINRDSSFPGVSFSETLQPALVREGEKNRPAVAVNSTLIYGDRLYTMLSSPTSLTRPISLSIKVPANCVPLKGQMLSRSKGFSAYTMLCQQPSGLVDLSFFPLEL